MLQIVSREGKMIQKLYENKITITAIAQISRIKPYANFTNIALQKIFFINNNNEYGFDHVWLQGRDYKLCSKLANVEESQWVEITFDFYEYRDKINRNKGGRRMKGLTIKSYKVLDKEQTEKEIGSKFNELKGYAFNNFDYLK